MPGGDREFGIESVAWQFASSVDIEDSAEVKTLISRQGYFEEAQVYDHSYSISVKGYGNDCPVAITDFLDTNAFGGITGKFIVNSNKSTQTNEDYQSWEYSGTIYPFAT